MLPVTQIDTFYNGLTLGHRDTINVAAGGTFMKRRPEECYDLIKNMTAHHNDWDTSAQRSESSSSITSSSDTKIAALKAEMAKINKNLMRVLPVNQQVKVVTPNCKTCGGPHSYSNCPATVGQTQNGASHGQNLTLAYRAPDYQAPGYQAPVHQPPIPQPQVVTTNEFTNYMKANDAILKNMQTNMTSLTNSNLELKNMFGGIFMKRRPEECYDLIENMTAHHNDWNTLAQQNESSSSITSSFDMEIAALKAEMARINKNLMRVLQNFHNQNRNQGNHNHQGNNQGRNQFFQGASHGQNTPSAYQAPVHQPLIPQSQVVTTNEFTNYMKANDAILKNMQTNMTSLTNSNLELKNMFGQFMKMNNASSSGSGTLLSNTITNLKVDLKGITTRSGTAYQGPTIPTTSSFLPQTGRALIDVFEGELTLRVGKEAITFNLDHISRYSANYNDMTANRINIINIACEEYSQEVLSFSDVFASVNPIPYYYPIVSTSSPTLTPFEDSDFLLEEVYAFLALGDDPTSPEVDHSYFDPKGDILLLEAFLTKSDKSSINEPLEVELKDLPPHHEYALLEGDDKLPVIIAKDLSIEEKTALITVLKSHKRAIAWKLSDIKDQENTTIMSPYGTFAYRCITFGLCNAPGTFQRYMMAIFHDMIQKTMDVFMDDISVFRNSFQNCLSHLEKMLKWCKDTNLCLNWEKSHFMVKEGIVLGHKFSKDGIEVDKAKVEAIAKLPHPTIFKGIRSFLSHAGFYRRFIKYFSKIARPMTRLFKKDTTFLFSKECVESFQTLKRNITEARILIAPDWDLPFKIMSDASDFAIGVVLGQRQEKHFRPIHYASNTMTEAESNYTTMEKEMLAVVYAFEKFRSYLILNKSIVYTDHSALKYLFAKKDS
nr:reverse transcriptase domain-containing protein [Tanacetum cinerariifolium]